MKYSILFAIAIAFALPLHAAHRQGANAKPKLTPEQIFNKKDANQDGFLSLEEFTGKAKNPAKKAKEFARKDTNHDGKLSLAEFVAKAKHHRKAKK